MRHFCHLRAIHQAAKGWSPAICRCDFFVGSLPRHLGPRVLDYTNKFTSEYHWITIELPLNYHWIPKCCCLHVWPLALQLQLCAGPGEHRRKWGNTWTSWKALIPWDNTWQNRTKWGQNGTKGDKSKKSVRSLCCLLPLGPILMAPTTPSGSPWRQHFYKSWWANLLLLTAAI